MKYLQSAEFAANAETTNRALWFKRNAPIEAFWTRTSQKIFQSTLDVDTLVTKINAEISHLGYGRKTRADEKLGASWSGLPAQCHLVLAVAARDKHNI